jgi:hypothetical protein
VASALAGAKDIPALEAALNQPEIWLAMRADLMANVKPLFLQAMLIGAELGLAEHPPTEARRRSKALALLARFGRKDAPGPTLEQQASAINTVAEEYVATYTDRWWESLQGTIRTDLRDAIAQASRTGGGALEVAARMDRVLGKARAEIVAVTEVTRLMGHGAQLQYARLGYGSWDWRTANDSRVDPICTAKAGDGPYTISIMFNPAHPRCRCWPVPFGQVNPAAAAGGVPETAPVAPFPRAGFLSHGEAEAWARARFPTIHEWSLYDVHLANLNDALRQLDKLETTHPGAFSVIKALGTRSSGGYGRSVMAQIRALPDGARFELNPVFFADRTRLLESMARSTARVPGVPAPWMASSNDVAGIISHEFGHVIDHFYEGYYRLPGVPRYNTAFMRGVSADGTGLVTDTWGRVRTRRAVNLSQYAKTNDNEKVAEAFAQMTTRPRSEWNAYTRVMRAYLDAAAPSEWLANGSWQLLADLPAEERQVASAALDLLRKRLHLE